MGLQIYFKDFNNKIKVDLEDRSELADKRDILLKKLRANSDIPSFEEFNQGSYSMYTGVEPLDKDYDIDVGLRFNINKSEFDELDLKNKIHETLKDHTDFGAVIKKPCVTVTYKKNGDIGYHVDLVAYSYEDKDDKSKGMYLARGTNDENKEWEKADPLELINEIMNKHTDTDTRDQYRRVIRYLKRWKNLKFKASGNSEPPGIGITLLVYEKFEPQSYDWLEGKYVYDDLQALIKVVEKIKGMFIYEYSIENSKMLYKIKYNLPVEPRTNVFFKMTDLQLDNFKTKIDQLLDELNEVNIETDIIEQCKKLRGIFGDDFPVPEAKDVYKSQRNFVPPNTASGMV